MTKRSIAFITLGIIATAVVGSVFFPTLFSDASQWSHVSLPAPNSGDQQTASQVFDIDGDTIDDIVVTERTASPSVVWYKRKGNNWEKHVIESSFDRLRIEAGGAHADIDGDGDLDVVFAGDNRSNEIWWWENPAPDFNKDWTRWTIKKSGGNKHHDSVFADIDGDNKLELVTWNQGDRALLVAEIPSNPRQNTEWNFQKAYTYSSTEGEHEGLVAYDMDGNGRAEVIGAGKIFTYNTSSGKMSVETIAAGREYTRTAVGQVIPGGKPEVFIGPGDENGDLIMYAAQGSSWTAQKTLKQNLRHGHSLQVVDLDKDGDLDVFTGEMGIDGITDPKTYFYTNDGAGNLTESQPISNQAHHESRIADLDGDGDMDILAKPYNWKAPRLDVYLNGGSPNAPPDSDDDVAFTSWSRHLITDNMGRATYPVWGDFDGDDKLDVAAGSNWYKNPGSLSGNWSTKNIGAPLSDVLLAFDADGDGDVDLFGLQQAAKTRITNSFAWAENDGKGKFTIRTNIANTGAGDFPQGVVVHNFGAGKEILLSWHADGDGLQSISVPTNPASTTWSIRKIASTTQEEDLSIGNINRSGKDDILLGTQWLENTGNAFTPHTLGDVEAGTPDRNDLADINGDGRLDAVVGLEEGKQLYWYEAPANPTDRWKRHTIALVEGQGFSMDVADFDGDGDPDVVVGEHRNPQKNRVLIFENQNKGENWVQHTADTGAADIDHHDGTQAVDLDRDGDLDLVSLGWTNKKLWVYENTSDRGDGTVPPPAPTDPGCGSTDVNRSGVVDIFDYSKVVQAFNPGSSIGNKAVDVTCDGFVNTDDLSQLIAQFDRAPNDTTPPPEPPADPDPDPQPPGNTGQEILLFDQRGLQFQPSDRGFLTHISENNANDHGPDDWMNPIDYWNGEFQVRYEIEEHPSNQKGRLQVCVWMNWDVNQDGKVDWYPENCSGQVQYSKAGDVMQNPYPKPNQYKVKNGKLTSEPVWYRKNNTAVNYQRADVFRIRTVLRGANGCNVTNYNVDKPCPESDWNKYKDMKYRLTIVLVPAGKQFSGWQNYQ